MTLFTIFKTNKQTNKTSIAGQTTKSTVPEQSPLVKKITGEKPSSAIKTENSSSFHTSEYIIDFVDKSTLGGEIPD